MDGADIEVGVECELGGGGGEGARATGRADPGGVWGGGGIGDGLSSGPLEGDGSAGRRSEGEDVGAGIGAGQSGGGYSIDEQVLRTQPGDGFSERDGDLVQSCDCRICGRALFQDFRGAGVEERVAPGGGGVFSVEEVAVGVGELGIFVPGDVDSSVGWLVEREGEGIAEVVGDGGEGGDIIDEEVLGLEADDGFIEADGDLLE